VPKIHRLNLKIRAIAVNAPFKFYYRTTRTSKTQVILQHIHQQVESLTLSTNAATVSFHLILYSHFLAIKNPARPSNIMPIFLI
jgi:hypothetical protein